MSDDKRDVSQSPVLLESNKSLSEDKAPTTTNTKGPPPAFENASVPEREIAKESPSTKKTEETDDLQPHEELYHWKKPIRTSNKEIYSNTNHLRKYTILNKVISFFKKIIIKLAN